METDVYPVPMLREQVQHNQINEDCHEVAAEQALPRIGCFRRGGHNVVMGFDG